MKGGVTEAMRIIKGGGDDCCWSLRLMMRP